MYELSPLFLETLRRHVNQSNFIEKIVSVPGELHYDQHLRAAELVAGTTEIIHPNDLHAILLGGILPFAGRYRDVETEVGNRPMPRSDTVPHLMERWWKEAKLAIEVLDVTKINIRRRSKEQVAFQLHNWFLCIHPYRNGNGRTARLILNMLRLEFGLEWHIVPADKKERYYDHIRRYENVTFRKCYSDAY